MPLRTAHSSYDRRRVRCICVYVYVCVAYIRVQIFLCNSYNGVVVVCQWRIHYFTLLIVLVCLIIISSKRLICCALLLLFANLLYNNRCIWMNAANKFHCCFALLLCLYFLAWQRTKWNYKSLLAQGIAMCLCVCVCAGKKVERNYKILVSSSVLSCRIWTYSFGLSFSCWRPSNFEIAK